MNKQERLIKIIKADGHNCNQIVIKIEYRLGGVNFFQGCKMPRGLYISVCPEFKTDGTTSFTAFSGTSTCVLPMKRFNKKKLDSYIPDKEIIQTLLDHVISKNKLTIMDEPDTAAIRTFVQDNYSIDEVCEILGYSDGSMTDSEIAELEALDKPDTQQEFAEKLFDLAQINGNFIAAAKGDVHAQAI